MSRMRAAREKVQRKDIEKKGVKADDLTTCFKDGVNLCYLYESISGKKLDGIRTEPHGYQIDNNLTIVLLKLNILVQDWGINVHYTPEMIKKGELRQVMGMLWVLISECLIPEAEEKTSKKRSLLRWVQKVVEPYKNVKVTNFTKSWVDGLAFNALLDQFDNTLMDYGSLTEDDPEKNCENAFAIAEKLGIYRLLDVKDIANFTVPDEKSVMMYVSSLYQYFDSVRKQKEEEERKKKEEEEKSKPARMKLELAQYGIETRKKVMRLKMKFKKMDKDGDGQISHEELKDALSKEKEYEGVDEDKLDDDALEKLIKFDVLGNEVVNLEEFIFAGTGVDLSEGKVLSKLTQQLDGVEDYDKLASRVKEMEEEHRSALETERRRVEAMANENQKILDKVLDSVGRKFRIPFKDLKVDNEGKLGHGGFGSVFGGQWTNEQGEKRDVAVKVISYGLQTGEEVFKEFTRSFQFRHENVIKTLGFDDSRSNQISIVMEKMDGNLHKYVRDKILTLEEKVELMLKMTKGILYLHEMEPSPFIHRDIKGENFLFEIGEDGELSGVKVCDFGLAKATTGTETQVSAAGQGTKLWMAPEAGKGLYSMKSDVYSLGITFWEILFEDYPYKDHDVNHVFTDVERNGLRPDLKMYQQKKDEEEEGEEEEGEVGEGYLPEILEELLKRCWCKDRKKRPTTRELVEKLEGDVTMEISSMYEGEHFPPLEIQEKNAGGEKEDKN